MIRNAVLLSLSVLVLSGCITVENAGRVDLPATGSEAYLALGSEPGWTLEITPQRLNYVGASGDRKIVEVNPGARASFNGQRYDGARLTVDITHGACSDGTSERRYADHVTVTADGATYRGCGGAILPPANLAGTRWRMLTIDGKSVDSATRTSMGFDGQTMSGSAGCNRFSASYTSDGTRLSTGPIAATKKGCTGPEARQETAAFSILAKPVTIRFAIDGKMILMGTAGRSIILEQTT
jgi:heat shock protein HslJ